MKLSTPPSPFSATFALTLSAMLLFASFELVQSSRIWDAIKRGARKCIGRTKSPEEPQQFPQHSQAPICGAECEKWEEPPKPFDYTLLIVHIRTGHNMILFATPIGKRLALTNRKSEWSGEKKDYSVFIKSETADEDIPISLNDEEKHCGLSEIHMKSTTDENEVVLLVLDKDLPDYILLASLPPPNTVPLSEGMKCNIPFCKENQNAEIRESSYTPVNIYGWDYTVKGMPRVTSSGQIKLSLDYNSAVQPPRGLPAVGACVMHKEEKRGLLFGTLNDNNPSHASLQQIFIVTLNLDEVLKWIDQVAGKNCVCKKP